MPSIRFAYATQYLIAVIAVYTLWSQVGGQSHLDLMPWYIKLALGAGAAFAAVKATAAAVSHDNAWNGGTLKWLGILLVLLAGCGISSYYAHLYLEEDDTSTDQDNTSMAIRPDFAPRSTRNAAASSGFAHSGTCRSSAVPTILPAAICKRSLGSGRSVSALLS